MTSLIDSMISDLFLNKSHSRAANHEASSYLTESWMMSVLELSHGQAQISI